LGGVVNLFDCLYPDCEEEAVFSTLRCVDHLGQTTLEYAEEYAVHLLTHERSGRALMDRARFDGTRDLLLKREAWRECSWIERAALIDAGVAVNVEVFPCYLRVAAMDPRSREILG
jgi:hypothetical protein